MCDKTGLRVLILSQRILVYVESFDKKAIWQPFKITQFEKIEMVF